MSAAQLTLTDTRGHPYTHREDKLPSRKTVACRIAVQHNNKCVSRLQGRKVWVNA